MPNQYSTRSFKATLEEYYNQSIRDIIISFQLKGYSYTDVSNLHDFNIATVYRNCARLSMTLKKTSIYAVNSDIVQDKIKNKFGMSIDMVKSDIESKRLTYAQIGVETGFTTTVIHKALS